MFELEELPFAAPLLLDFFCLLLEDEDEVVSEAVARGSTGRFEERDN